MKKLAPLFLLTVMGSPAYYQTALTPLPDSVASFLDKSLTLLQTYSLERNTVNWPQLRQTAHQRAQGATTVRDLLPLYPFLFEQLNDDYGWLTYQDETYKWHSPARPAYANEAVKAALKKMPGVLVKMLPDHVGYIQLPGINAWGSLEEMSTAARMVQDSLCCLPITQVRA